MFKRYPDTEQFKNCIKQVHEKTTFAGLAPDGTVLRNHNAPMPKIKFVGTVKLHGCISREAMITLANGEKEKLKNIRSGDSILSYDESSQSLCFNEVGALIVQSLDKDWVELAFDNGSTLQCTEDHLVLTDSGWKEAKSLTVLDEIVSDGIK